MLAVRADQWDNMHNANYDFLFSLEDKVLNSTAQLELMDECHYQLCSQSQSLAGHLLHPDDNITVLDLHCKSECSIDV